MKANFANAASKSRRRAWREIPDIAARRSPHPSPDCQPWPNRYALDCRRHLQEALGLRQIEVLNSEANTVARSVRAIEVTKATYGGRREEDGGVKADQVRWLKELDPGWRVGPVDDGLQGRGEG